MPFFQSLSYRRFIFFTILLSFVSGCDAFQFFKSDYQGLRKSKIAPKQREPSLIPTVESDSCELVSSVNATLPMKPLTNAEYELSIKELLTTSENASASLPPDAIGSGFDTASIRTLTGSLAQSYLDASQKMASQYVNQPNAICADKNFSRSCVVDAVASLAQKAFRRPLLVDEAKRLRELPGKFADSGLSNKEAYSAALATILFSPQFLYRPNLVVNAGISNVDQYALASKLSYALWSSLPDRQLLAAASSGRLSSPSAFAAEIERMINSPKSQAFVRNFVGQWLGTKSLAQSPPAKHLAPEMPYAMAEETLGFVSEFLHENRNIRNMLDAPFTYIDSRLANHYGLKVDNQDVLQRVSLSGGQRGGLLTQGAFLLQTSNPDGNSPVKRGKWVLERLLCAPPPAPPPGVQTVLDSSTEKSLPMRQRLESHGTVFCASCHKSMDPIGLAFENYDFTGKWRDKDEHGEIDASGTLPSGEKFENAASLARLIKADPAFPQCVATKISQYVLGREPSKKEQCLINKIAARTRDDNYGFKNMLADLVRVLLTK